MQYTDDVCKRKVEEFIAANGHQQPVVEETTPEAAPA